MKENPVALVTGANRGIGLELEQRRLTLEEHHRMIEAGAASRYRSVSTFSGSQELARRHLS